MRWAAVPILLLLLAGCELAPVDRYSANGLVASPDEAEALGEAVVRMVEMVRPPAATTLALRMDVSEEDLVRGVVGALTRKGYGVSWGDDGVPAIVKIALWERWALLEARIADVTVTSMVWRDGSGRGTPVVLREEER